MAHKVFITAFSYILCMFIFLSSFPHSPTPSCWVFLFLQQNLLLSCHVCSPAPPHILLSECYLLPYPHINVKVYNLHERQYNTPYLSLCIWPILLNLITFRSISVPTDAILYFFMVEQNPTVYI